MADVDLNLLPALDALLDEGSVVRAARRLGLSPSAMSRTLARLRSATGDPLLVRAGRGLVPTLRAAELRDRVHVVMRDAKSVLSPQTCGLDLAALETTFVIRTSLIFVELFSTALIAAVAAAAPRVRLRFALKPDKDARPLREGRVDLEIGVLGTSAPELRTQSLFNDRYVGVARVGHPLSLGPITTERYSGCSHVVVSRKGASTGPVDEALQALGLTRDIKCIVPGHADAMRIASRSQLVALVPYLCFAIARDTATPLVQELFCFELPVSTEEITISAMWHPRVDVDPAHRWFREMVLAVCRDAQTRASAAAEIV